MDWKDYQRVLREQPVRTLSVLVEALGSSVGHTRGEELWSLTAGCDAWRVEGGELQRSKLYLHGHGNRAELQPWGELLSARSCVMLRARLLETGVMGARAWIEEHIGPSDDPELAALRAELFRPVTIEDALLGRLTLDRTLGAFEGEVVWCGRKVRLAVHPKDCSAPEAALHVARALAASAEAWQTRVEDYAVGSLLGLKNEEWLAEGEAPLDAATFTSRMSLTDIEVEEGGGLSFWHDDGNMFWGHSILVGGDLESGPNHADIPG